MFDDIKSLGSIAVGVVQRKQMRKAFEEGRFYFPQKSGITLGKIEEAFRKAQWIYHQDKSLPYYQPRSTDLETDPFKRMLTSVAMKTLRTQQENDESVTLLRHVLGHMFSWRRNGALSDEAKVIAREMHLIN